MTTTIEDRTAAAVMSPGVVSVEEDDSIQDAMRKITEHHVSGVPVVDRENRCIGVISTSDIVAFIEADQEFLEGQIPRSDNWFNPETQKWEELQFSPELLGEYDLVKVSEAMTSDPVTVTPATPIDAVARILIEHSIHRILVVDDEQRLQGVISAMDFVQLIADA